MKYQHPFPVPNASSARWGTAADIAPYVDPVPDWNIPLTQTEKLTMSSRPKNPKYARNKNILVIGGSGSGKTRFFVKPSLMQMHSSYVVTDPKGQLLSEVGTMLRRGAPKLDENGKPMRDARGKVIYEPYRIKVLNTINFMLQSQLFNLLCDKADDVYGGRLPVHVRCLLDEFTNIGQIPNFDKLIATIRSREISASIILQSQSQLKTIYKDAADTIVSGSKCQRV